MCVKNAIAWEITVYVYFWFIKFHTLQKKWITMMKYSTLNELQVHYVVYFCFYLQFVDRRLWVFTDIYLAQPTLNSALFSFKTKGFYFVTNDTFTIFTETISQIDIQIIQQNWIIKADPLNETILSWNCLQALLRQCILRNLATV